MRQVCLAAAIAALAPIASGCAGPQEGSATIAPPSAGAARRKPRLVPGELWKRQFVAVSFVRRGDRSGVEPVPHSHFSFARERIAGRVRETIGWDDGCNGYGGSIRVRGATMRVWNVAGTTVACVSVGRDGKPVIEHGPLLMNFLGGKMRWRLRGGRLALSRGTQTLLMRETRSWRRDRRRR